MSQSSEVNGLTRRRLLGTIGVLAATAAASPVLSAYESLRAGKEIRKGDKLYKASKRGKIYESSNDGQTWELVMNFGRRYTIRNFDLYQDGFMIQLRYERKPIQLKSADCRLWYTWDWKQPS